MSFLPTKIFLSSKYFYCGFLKMRIPQTKNFCYKAVLKTAWKPRPAAVVWFPNEARCLFGPLPISLNSKGVGSNWVLFLFVMDSLFVRQLRKLLSKTYSQQMNQKCKNLPPTEPWMTSFMRCCWGCIRRLMCVEMILPAPCRKASLVSLFIISRNENNITALIKENGIEASFKPVSQICPDNIESGKSLFSFYLPPPPQCNQTR